MTRLAGRQLWSFAGGRPVAAAYGGVRIAAEDARIAHLGIRRDAHGHPFPVGFAYSTASGAPLGPPVPVPAPAILDIDPDGAYELPLPTGLPSLVRAGRPMALYLFQDNLGAFEGWDGRRFVPLGRMPACPVGTGLAPSDRGIAYATADALVTVTLPQLGPSLATTVLRADRVRFLSAPCWRGADCLVLGARDGQLVLCRAGSGTDGLDLLALPAAAAGGAFAGPWTNRMGDAFWSGPDGFVTCPAAGGPEVLAWPDGFAPITGLDPWCDRAGLHHQPGLLEGRYALAALAPAAAAHGLDGPHLAAGTVTYCGAERFDVPWREPTETLNLGPHAGALLVPLLAMPRDTVLLALDVAGPRAGILRGARLAAPATGRVLHHAHGVGLHRLPVALEIGALDDARALLHDGRLYLWSRCERRCHALPLRPA